MTELRKCPFCGGKATVINLYGTIYFGKRRWYVVCLDCGLSFTYGLTYGGLHTTKQRCVDDWNKRVESDTE